MADIAAGSTRQAHQTWSNWPTFILAVAGSAVGLGNIWKFPYITGENGGGAFVIVYLVCIAAIGVPIMIAEIMLGRRGRRSPVTSMVELAKESNRFGHADGVHDQLTGFVFSTIDGTQIKSFKKGLRALLDAAGLRRDPNDGERDAYSMRHYYATQRLLAGVSVYTLAENMGTSVAMIEKHYGHVRPELAADELMREPDRL